MTGPIPYRPVSPVPDAWTRAAIWARIVVSCEEVWLWPPPHRPDRGPLTARSLDHAEYVGPTSSQSSGSPKFERSEQQRIDRAHLTLDDRARRAADQRAPMVRRWSLV